MINYRLTYKGFDVYVMSPENGLVKTWYPGQFETSKNLFCTYIYRGRLTESLADSNEIINDFVGEKMVNWNVVHDVPTNEYYENDAVWLCFSSWKPYNAEYHRLNGTLTVPPNTGVYCVLGNFKFEDKKVTPLYYIAPREHDIEINGNAKIILIKLGEFINTPT